MKSLYNIIPLKKERFLFIFFSLRLLPFLFPPENENEISLTKEGGYVIPPDISVLWDFLVCTTSNHFVENQAPTISRLFIISA